MQRPEDPLAWMPLSPAPIAPELIPERLRGNTLVLHLLGLTPAEEALYAALAETDATEDAHSVALVLAEAK